ncbi:MAG: hypothetical protein H7281_06840 [Bacteriovorax sp.]|nr:hypothetical protein [Bacteriovorax sp.]
MLITSFSSCAQQKIAEKKVKNEIQTVLDPKMNKREYEILKNKWLLLKRLKWITDSRHSVMPAIL